MHKPLFVGIALPYIRYHPWSLRQTLLLVEMEGRLREVFKSCSGDGRSILCELLRIPGRLGGMSYELARQVLRMPREGMIPHQGSPRCSWERVIQADQERD
jgi:hypothetical protein